MKFNVNFKCPSDWSDWAISKASIDFIDERGGSVGQVLLPYTNRNKRNPRNVVNPILENKTVRFDGRTTYAASEVDFGNISLLHPNTQARGITHENHWLSKHIQGKFTPQKAGIYQFAVVNTSNLCVKQSYGSRCSEVYASGSILEINGSAVILDPRSETGKGYMPSTNFGTFLVSENKVGKPHQFQFSAIGNWELDGNNQAWVTVEDVKERQPVDNFNQAVQSVSLLIREPDAMYFRPLAKGDFAEVKEEVIAATQDDMTDESGDVSWVTGEEDIIDNDIIEIESDDFLEEDTSDFVDGDASTSEDDESWLGSTDEEDLEVDSGDLMDALGLDEEAEF